MRCTSAHCAHTAACEVLPDVQKYFVFLLFVFKQALTVTFRCKKNEETAGMELVKTSSVHAGVVLGVHHVDLLVLHASLLDDSGHHRPGESD